MSTLLLICKTHGTWDMDFDPPQCYCDDLELMVIEDQEELPFSNPDRMRP